MNRRRKITSSIFTGVAAVGAVGLGTGVAHAASGKWTVTPGGAYQAENETSASLIANGTHLTCGPSTAFASGSLHNASGNSPVVGSIANATFGTSSRPCTLAGLVNFTAKLKNPPAPLNIKAKSYNATTGVTTGVISGNISASLTGVGSNCHAIVTGTSIPGSFNNTTHALTINPGGASTLTIHSVSGCNGLIQNSEKAGFKATYITSPQQTITDP